MKDGMTLFNMVLRKSYSNWNLLSSVGTLRLRKALNEAYRFVLDDSMCTFLIDLAAVSYKESSAKNRFKKLDKIVSLARSPHKTVWIEFSRAEYHKAILSLSGETLIEGTRTIEGWLIESHPDDDQNFRVTIFLVDTSDSFVTLVPISILWTTSSNAQPLYWESSAWDPLPRNDQNMVLLPGVLFGHEGYPTNAIALSSCPYSDVNLVKDRLIPAAIVEFFSAYFTGNFMLRLVTFLATLTDLPMVVSKTSPTHRSFLGEGRIRKFLDYDSITLRIPNRHSGYERSEIIKEIIGRVHRRAHMVRGHWRHFSDEKVVWVKEHQRGDATLGFVKHTYNVTHSGDRDA